MQRLRVGGAWEEADTRRVYQGGIWKTVKKAWVYASGDWRLYFIGAIPMTVSISPPLLELETSGVSTISGSATAVVAGGIGPYTYSWTVLTFSAPATPTIANATSATATFTQTGVSSSSPRTATFRVNATDSTGQTVSADIEVFFINLGSS